MSRFDPTQKLVPSVLDRLMGAEDNQFGESIARIVATLQRDIEDLLNTRCTHQGVIPPDRDILVNSMLTYGLPDFGTIVGDTHQKRKRIAQMMEQAVARFEPRLKDIRVRLLGESETNETHLQFQLSARLVVEPHPDIAFMTELDIITGETQIQEN